METSPTVGFNVGTLDLDKKLSLTLWDVGGQTNMRTNWSNSGSQMMWLLVMTERQGVPHQSQREPALFGPRSSSSFQSLPLG
ncbi:hypothetical protein NHX12_006234 [Muraenolepis orangiensis]|uniref:Uncharacterized protein n=1 Tax=Muraenolepis orangiensis TaxID=630683 RepID=A0A9Q0DSX8_9TELE|nr:hypothetical protein NHX12_006234 [Muraenolepis orangiensis]